MHLRKAKVKDRLYLSIVQSYRTDDGKTRSKTIRTIGYADTYADKFEDPVAHFEEVCKQMNEEAKKAFAPIIVEFSPAKKIDARTENTISLGASIFSSYYHRDLGIWDFFERKRTARNFKYDPSRILELLVWNRISDPTSKRCAWQSRGCFPRKCNFSLEDVYRALTYLNKNSDALLNHMNKTLEMIRGKRNKTRLYYDVTNYYFEIENDDIGSGGLRKHGVSKEHRPNPIVQMGLIIDEEGIPLDYEIFPGNTNDMTTMLPMMKKARLRSKGDIEQEHVIMVADKGLNTSNNIAACTLDGNGFIFSQSVRKATRELKVWILNETGYRQSPSKDFKIKSRIADKAIYITGEDGKRHKVVVPVKEVAFWSKDHFLRSRHERYAVIDKSYRAISNNEITSALAKTSIRYVVDKPAVRKTGEVASHNWVIDEKKIAEDEKMDGYYCIITSEQEMDDRDIIEAYRGLWRIEDSFRVLKSDFDARPVYVSRADHIRAHFLICYIALLIMRLMEYDTKHKYTSTQIAKGLKSMVGHKMDTNTYLFDYRSELTDDLSRVVGIDLSRQVLTRAKIRQIMADVKKSRR